MRKGIEALDAVIDERLDDGFQLVIYSHNVRIDLMGM